MSNLLHFVNRIVPKKQNTYEWWWSSPVKSLSNDWKSGSKHITHGQYVVSFYRRLKDLIERKGYEITDEKQFKSAVATFIYNLSDEYL